MATKFKKLPEKKPIAKLSKGEQILGGDQKYINPIRKIGKGKEATGYMKGRIASEKKPPLKFGGIY